MFEIENRLKLIILFVYGIFAFTLATILRLIVLNFSDAFNSIGYIQINNLLQILSLSGITLLFNILLIFSIVRINQKKNIIINS